MRKFPVLVSALLAVACNNSNESTASIQSKPDSSSVDENVTYAYTPKNKPNWERGDPKKIAFALNALKKYETGNLDALKDDFADSVSFAGDRIEFRGSRDSMISLLKKEWSQLKGIHIQMDDWEAVHGKDNNEDWVSIWYKEVRTGKDGKVDSSHNMDDIKVENGKITTIDSKQRRFPEKK